VILGAVIFLDCLCNSLGRAQLGLFCGAVKVV